MIHAKETTQKGNGDFEKGILSMGGLLCLCSHFPLLMQVQILLPVNTHQDAHSQLLAAFCPENPLLPPGGSYRLHRQQVMIVAPIAGWSLSLLSQITVGSTYFYLFIGLSTLKH